jgi:hypothetical protein
MENEREIVQWYLTAGLYEAPALFNTFPDRIRRQCFVGGTPASWDRLPVEVKAAIAARRAAVCAEGERIAAEIDKRETAKIEAILLLGQLTAARFDVYALAGPANAAARAALMSLLTGGKIPQAKAGVHALQAALFADIRGECEAEKERHFVEYCERLCRSQRNNPAAQTLADKAQARREEREQWAAKYAAESSAA